MGRSVRSSHFTAGTKANEARVHVLTPLKKFDKFTGTLSDATQMDRHVVLLLLRTRASNPKRFLHVYYSSRKKIPEVSDSYRPQATRAASVGVCIARHQLDGTGTFETASGAKWPCLIEISLFVLIHVRI